MIKQKVVATCDRFLDREMGFRWPDYHLFSKNKENNITTGLFSPLQQNSTHW